MRQVAFRVERYIVLPCVCPLRHPPCVRKFLQALSGQIAQRVPFGAGTMSVLAMVQAAGDI